MENKKSKRIFKVVMAAMSLALVAAISYGATVAFMSSKTNDKNNVFTSSASLKIDILENNWDANSTYSPDSVIDKDPQIKVEEDSDSAYIACKIMFLVADEKGTLDEEGEVGTGYKSISYNDFKKVATFVKSDTSEGINDAWQILSTSENEKKGLILYYTKVHDDHRDLLNVDKDNLTTEIFNKVKFKGQDALQKEWTTALDKTSADFCLYDSETGTYKNLVVKVFAYAIDTNLANEEQEGKLLLGARYPSIGDYSGKIDGMNRGQYVLNRMIAGLSVEN